MTIVTLSGRYNNNFPKSRISTVLIKTKGIGGDQHRETLHIIVPS